MDTASAGGAGDRNGMITQSTRVELGRRAGDVLCPEHKTRMERLSYPSRSWRPTSARNGENVTDAVGLAYCEACDDTYEWVDVEMGRVDAQLSIGWALA